MGDSLYQCFLRGVLKKEGSEVLVGDQVVVDSLDEANLAGRVVQVLERHSQLSRPKIANITDALVVASISNPAFDFVQTDRYLTHIQLAGIQPCLCISKADLAASREDIAAIRAVYEPLGIPVFSTSIFTPETVSGVFSHLEGKTVVLAGPSGAGKSSLLNAIQPDLNLRVQETSEKLQRGQHTTRHVTLIELCTKTYVADTPGFSYLKFDTVMPKTLESVFPEFVPYRTHCRFQDCLHLDEEACAVKADLETLAESRYESYVLFQAEAQEGVEVAQNTSNKQEYGYKTLKRGKQKQVQILKLHEKQREASRRTKKQQIQDWTSEDGTLEDDD